MSSQDTRSGEQAVSVVPRAPVPEDGSPLRAALLPGDLIGRDLAGPVTMLLSAAGARIVWEWLEVGAESLSQNGASLPEDVLETVRATKVALKGPIKTPVGSGYESPSVRLRKALGLYAGVRMVRNVPGIAARYADVDLTVIRESTEDVYAGLEHEVVPGVVESIKVVTRKASERIFDFAYRYAQERGYKRLAITHKANIMKQADGLFLRVGREVSGRYPEIETREYIVDNACQQLVQNPWQFDVIVCGNLYGDILSDLACGLTGGISSTAGMNVGDDCVLFDCFHGNVPWLMGTDKANPLPMLLPAIRMLRHVGQSDVADRLYDALCAVLREGKYLTADLGGQAKTSEMLKAIEGALQ